MNEPDTFIFDLDGTVFLGNRLLPRVKEKIEELKRRRKRIMYLTNTSIRSRESLAVFLLNLGLEVEVEEIVTAAHVAGWYFHRRVRDSVKERVLVIGSGVLVKELEHWGVEVTNDPLKASHVLVGIDFSFDYETLLTGMKALDAGAVLVAVNPDPYCPLDGDRIPDTGAFTAALETASQTKEKIIIGKPSPIMGEYFSVKIDGLLSRCLFIGDRIETDIYFGKSLNMQTALVLTGAASQKDVDNSVVKPDYVWEDMRGLM